MQYGEEFPNLRIDFPLPPTKEVVKIEWFKDDQEKLREKLCMHSKNKNKRL